MSLHRNLFNTYREALSYRRETRIAAWLCVLLLAIFSLIPGNIQARSGMPGGIEHAIAYFGTATLFMLSYEKRSWEIAAGLTGYSGTLEILQLLVPGRTSNFADMLASGAGAVFGVVVWTILLKQAAR